MSFALSTIYLDNDNDTPLLCSLLSGHSSLIRLSSLLVITREPYHHNEPVFAPYRV